jgi:hypothetical protein
LSGPEGASPTFVGLSLCHRPETWKWFFFLIIFLHPPGAITTCGWTFYMMHASSVWYTHDSEIQNSLSPTKGDCTLRYCFALE